MIQHSIIFNNEARVNNGGVPLLIRHSMIFNNGPLRLVPAAIPGTVFTIRAPRFVFTVKNRCLECARACFRKRLEKLRRLVFSKVLERFVLDVRAYLEQKKREIREHSGHHAKAIRCKTLPECRGQGHGQGEVRRK